MEQLNFLNLIKKIIIKDNGIMVKYMELENWYGEMVHLIKDNILMVKKMD